MAGKSAIEWTGGTWNVVTGCTKVSPGCAHCYIERTIPFRTAGRRFELVDGESTTGVRLHPERLEPSHNLYPSKLDDPIFVCSLADLFHDDVDFRFLAEVFAVMALCTDRTFQVLTKRPERMRELLTDPLWWACVEGAAQRRHEEVTGEDVSYTLAIHGHVRPLPNVWLGVSIENARYTWRADVLREIPAAVRFLSCEPLLGSLYDRRHNARPDEGRDGSIARRSGRDLAPSGADLLEDGNDDSPRDRAGDPREASGAARASAALAARAPLDLTGIDWVIVGGESGGRFARPMHPEWAREIRDACLRLEACERHVGDPHSLCEACWQQPRPAFHFKQWGSWGPGDPGREAHMVYLGANPKSGGRLLDGRTWDELPALASTAPDSRPCLT